MQNSSESSRQTTQHEETIDNGETAGKPSQPCPAGTPWCRRHDETVCWSRSILVDETHIDIAKSSTDLTLYGLGDFRDAPNLDTARRIAEAITTLIDEVEPAGQPAATTAAYTWHDLAATDSLLLGLQLLDANRVDLPLGTEDLRDDCRTYPAYGGLLAWNLTRDEESGHLVMLAGQTAEQEQQVMANAAWLVSCGAVYAAARVGMKGWKTAYDDRCTIEGDEFLVWVLENDGNISEQMGMRR